MIKRLKDNRKYCRDESHECKSAKTYKGFVKPKCWHGLGCCTCLKIYKEKQAAILKFKRTLERDNLV